MFGFIPSTAWTNLASAWKKCGQDNIMGDPYWHILTLNTPDGTSGQPPGLLQKQALSGFSCGVP